MSQMGTYTEVNKLVGTGAVGSASQGSSVKLSEDGNFLFIGASVDSGGIGAVWFYQKINGVWKQKQKIVPTGFSGTSPYFGFSIAVNPSMDALFVGAVGDSSAAGASFVFTFDGTTWTQQGDKLVGRDVTGSTASRQGQAVALSADGNTAIVGGPYDADGVGAAWIFVRVGDNWATQGSKLVGSGSIGQPFQGTAVAITSDGNLVVVGGNSDNTGYGAFWVFLRSGFAWNQVGTKVTVADEIGNGYFGTSLALSGDDQTLVAGGYYDNGGIGATWIFKRNGNTFAQFGNKLVGVVATSNSYQGRSVAVNKLGTVVAVGAYQDSSNAGAVFMYYFDGTTYKQLGNKIIAVDATGLARQGYSVALDSSGSQLLFGGYSDNGGTGAAWIYANAAITSSPSFAPTAPTMSPSNTPTAIPTILPTTLPTMEPTLFPTFLPTILPTALPTITPSTTPTVIPSVVPTTAPTAVPTILPSTTPTMEPTLFPTFLPTGVPNLNPTIVPSRHPSFTPSTQPTNQPSIKPSLAPIALTGATTSSPLDMLSIIIIAVIGGLALICTLLLIRYRLSRNYREADTAIGEMNEWIEDAKTNANHGSYIQLQHSSKQAKAEDPLLTDIYATNKRSDEML